MSAGSPASTFQQLLTTTEVADSLRVSKMTVYRLVHAGELPAVRVGRSLRIPSAGFRDYLTRADRESSRQ